MGKQGIVHHALEQLAPLLLGDKFLPNVQLFGESPIFLLAPSLKLIRTISKKRSKQKRLKTSAPTRHGKEVKERKQRLGLGRGVYSLFLVD